MFWFTHQRQGWLMFGFLIIHFRFEKNLRDYMFPKQSFFDDHTKHNSSWFLFMSKLIFYLRKILEIACFQNNYGFVEKTIQPICLVNACLCNDSFWMWERNFKLHVSKTIILWWTHQTQLWKLNDKLHVSKTIISNY